MASYVMAQLYVSGEPVTSVKVELGGIGAHVSAQYYAIAGNFTDITASMWQYDVGVAQLHILPDYINSEEFGGIEDVWIQQAGSATSRSVDGYYKTTAGDTIKVTSLTGAAHTNKVQVGFGYTNGNYIPVPEYPYGGMYFSESKPGVYGVSTSANISRFLELFMSRASSGGGGAGGDTSEGGVGGGGNQDNSSGPVDANTFSPDEGDPNYNPGAARSGLLALYSPTQEQLNKFAGYLWSTNLIDAIVKFVNDPVENVIVLNRFPIMVPTAGDAEVSFGGVLISTLSGGSFKFPFVNSQYVTVECGSIDVEEYWGNSLDYSPNTKANIYLPYIGFRELDIDDVMGATITLKYNVDLLSGDCVAQIYVDRDSSGTHLQAPLYVFDGAMACSIPLTAAQAGQRYLAAFNLAGSAISPTAGVGAMANNLMNAQNVIGAKTQYSRSGTLKSVSGEMAPQVPFLVLTRPIQSLPEGFNKFEGYPSNVTATLGDLTGYTLVKSVHLEGIPATSEELSEIQELLTGGVFV